MPQQSNPSFPLSYWLMKSEPDVYSWQRLLQEKVTGWEGVRNYQASNNLKAMKKGDLAFFYHSVHEKCIVGIVKIIREYYPDPTDKSGRFGQVDVEFHQTLQRPVSLHEIKEDTRLHHLALVRQSRLSVTPIDPKSWKIICEKGGLSC